jgi:peptidoglycan-N-acetylglucosamine deacetylase
MNKTVVLTFDDGTKSHRTMVAPYLFKLGFGATFYVTHAWMNDPENYLDWNEIAEIDAMGFEIGNHSWSHLIFSKPEIFSLFTEELLLVEKALKKVGVKKPTSFAWPANRYSKHLFPILKDLGYQSARGGYHYDNNIKTINSKKSYETGINNLFTTPSTMIATPELTFDHFKRIVNLTEKDNTVILQFHGVPEVTFPQVDTPVKNFISYMNYLKQENFTVISMEKFGSV